MTTNDPSEKDRDEKNAVDDIIDFATAKGEADSPASDSEAPAPPG